MSALPAVARTSNLPDSELVERARAGDAHAIEQLIRRYNRKLYRTARAIVGKSSVMRAACRHRSSTSPSSRCRHYTRA